MKFYHKLRTRLLVVFFIITFIPAFITGIYAIQVSTNTLLWQTLMRETEKAKKAKEDIKMFLSAIRSDLLFLSQSAPMKDYLSLLTAVFESQEKTFSTPPGSFDNAKQAIQKVLEQKQQVIEREFLAFSRNRRVYYQVRYINEKGHEVVRVDSDSFRSWIVEQDKLQNKSDRYYFLETMRLSGKQVFVSPLDLNRERGKIEKPHKPVIRYAINVYDDYNRKAGIIILNVDANQFLKPLAETRLINQDGYFLNHSEPDNCWGGPNDENHGYNLNKEYSQLEPKVREKLLIREGNVLTDEITLAHQKINVPGSFEHWVVIIQQDTDEILKNVHTFRKTFIIILIIAILIALVFSVLFSTTITRPIEHLTNIADAISKGELVDNRVDVNDKGEIGQLAKAFERMRVSMLKSFERLRKQSRI